MLVRYFAGARAAAGVCRGEGRRADARRAALRRSATRTATGWRAVLGRLFVPRRRAGVPRPVGAALRRHGRSTSYHRSPEAEWLIVVFLLVVFGVLFGIHFYLWKRLVKDTTTTRPVAAGSARWRMVGDGAAGRRRAVLRTARAAGRGALDRLARRTCGWRRCSTCSCCCGAGGAAAGAAADLGRGGAGRRRCRSPRWCRPRRTRRRCRPRRIRRPGRHRPATGASARSRPPIPARRLLLARGAGARRRGHRGRRPSGTASRQAIGPPQLDRVTIPLAKLPRRLDGTAHRAGLRHPPRPAARPRRTPARIVDMINGSDADLVAVVGDLVDGTVAELGAAGGAAGDLRARHGSFFVTGNHEYFSGYEEWIAEVDSLGLRLLRNERVEIDGPRPGRRQRRHRRASTSDGPDFDQALGGRDPARPVVLLAHQPVQVDARPRSTASTCSCPGTPTAARSSRSTCIVRLRAAGGQRARRRSTACRST